MAISFKRAHGSRLRIPHAAGLSKSGDMSHFITVHFPQRPTVNDETHSIIMKGAWGACNYGIDYRLNSGSGTRRLRCGFTDTGATDRQLDTDYEIYEGETHRIGFTWNETSKLMSLYACRLEVLQQPSEGAFTLLDSNTFAGVSPQTNSSDLYVGSLTNTTASPYTACEFASYNTVLSKATADGYLPQRLTGYESGCTSYWPMNDGPRGITAYDTKGVSDGTLQFGARWGSDPVDLPYPTGIFDTAVLGVLDLARLIDASFTASDENPSYPVERLYSEKCSFVTRTASAAGLESWTLDLGPRAASVALFAFRNHNFTSGATLLLQGNDTDSWGAPTYSANLTYHNKDIYHFLDMPRELRYWKLSVTNTALSYYQLGSFEAWHCWDVARSTNSVSKSYVDPSTETTTRFGKEVPYTLTNRRTISVGWSDIPVEQANELRRLLSLHSKGGTFFALTGRRFLYSEGFTGHIRQVPSRSLSSRSGQHIAGTAFTLIEDIA